MKLNILFLVLTSIFLLETTDLKACSSFSFISANNNVIAAKNYDWFFLHGHGGIYVYPRGTQRVAFTPEEDSFFSWFKSTSLEHLDKPFSWKSKYGSITFTQFGKGLPIGGMNEKGLVVEMLQLNSTKYPPKSKNKPAVNESQWALFQLDQFATTQEVVNHLENLRVSKAFIGIHYFITDASGASAVVEFLNGTPTIYHGDTLPVSVLTNDPYLELFSHDRDLHKHNNLSSIWLFRTSENRFATASKLLKPEIVKEVKNGDVDYAFHVLNSVCLNGSSIDAFCEPTQWSIVYDITKKEIHFKTRSNPNLRTLKMHELNFDSLNTVKVLDMNTASAGNITSHLQDYSPGFNSKLVNLNSWLLSDRLREAALEHADQEGYQY